MASARVTPNRLNNGLTAGDVTLSTTSMSPDAVVQSPLPSTSPPHTPKASQSGLHGQYIGPASAVSFLQRVQQRLGQAANFSQPDNIFTFGDTPFEEIDADPSSCMMLPRDVAQQFFNRYFDFAMPTYRFLHRPTLQVWLREFYDTFGVMHDSLGAPAKIALVLMVLAHGRMYLPEKDKAGPSDFR